MGAKITPERGTVGNDPGFHACFHELELGIGSIARTIPCVTAQDMFPGRKRHYIFAIDKEHACPVRFRDGFERNPKIPKRLSTATTSNDTGHTAIKTRPLKQFTESLAAANLEFLTISSPFDIECDVHQRVPPISPRIHNWPRR